MKSIADIKVYVKPMLESIAKTNHSIKSKQDVKVFDDRIAMACPCCGDSEKVHSKKRGNLYLKSLRYKCFNCGVSYTLFEFLKLYNQVIDIETKRDLADYVEENILKTKWHEDEFVTNSLDKLIPIDVLSSFFNGEEERNPMSDFRPVTKGSKVYQYLMERKITNHDDIYEATYWHTSNWNEPVLVNMNQAKGKVIGIQTRNLKGRDKRFYKIFSFSELYNLVYGVEIDEIEKIGYDKLSYLYNILKVNWGGDITIFEGFLDTKFFPNAIGCVGTNTDLNFLLNQDLNLRFFYDYDSAGIKKQKQYIKKGYPVFLWERLFDSWSTMSKNPYRAYLKLTKNIVDLNDVAKVAANPYAKLKLESFFSKDQLDIMWVKDIKYKMDIKVKRTA
jgi:transposase-like protein